MHKFLKVYSETDRDELLRAGFHMHMKKELSPDLTVWIFYNEPSKKFTKNIHVEKSNRISF